MLISKILKISSLSFTYVASLWIFQSCVPNTDQSSSTEESSELTRQSASNNTISQPINSTPAYLGSLRNGGVGHDTTFASATTTDRTALRYDTNGQHDFNSDKINDRYTCSTTTVAGKPRIHVQIISGKDNSYIVNWAGPGWLQDKYYADSRRMGISGCDVVYLSPFKPSLIVATKFNSPSIGDRIRSPQYIIYRSTVTNTMSPQQIMIPGSTNSFSAASRSVKCTQVTRRLLTATRKSGALCFFAAYDTALHDGVTWGTNTSLVKFEQGPNDTFIARDITLATELPWKGMTGTKQSQIPSRTRCNGVSSPDGIHMMDSAFLDFNRDDLPDFVTVGQHASIRSHQMILNSSKPEGFVFRTSYIHDVSSGMSEFYRVTALQESDKYIDSSCVYISGENDNSCGKVRDHMRCFRNNAWETSYPNGSEFFSLMERPVTKPNGRGKLVVKAGSKYFTLNAAFENRIDLTLGALQRTATDLIVSGWACRPNTSHRAKIIISSSLTPYRIGYPVYFDKLTDMQSETNLMKRCENPHTSYYRFRATIPKSSLHTASGTLYISADLNYVSTAIPTTRQTISY